MKNVVEKSKHVDVDSRYDLTYKGILDLYNAYYDDPFELISSSFKIGYMQGAKAEKKKRAIAR